MRAFETREARLGKVGGTLLHAAEHIDGVLLKLFANTISPDPLATDLEEAAGNLADLVAKYGKHASESGLPFAPML